MASELALFAFTACNTLRVVAYVPQILKIAQDRDGAKAISYSTWGLFGVSHLSTVAYAIATLNDWRLALIFTVNAAACAAIVGLTLYKRLRLTAQASKRAQPKSETASSARVPSVRPCRPALVSDCIPDHPEVAILSAERRRIVGRDQ